MYIPSMQLHWYGTIGLNIYRALPKTLCFQADGLYLYTADVKTSELTGYFVKHAGGVSNNFKLGGQPTN